MGSGCSSPLKRFGGKRGKPTRRSSSPYNSGRANDNQLQDVAANQNEQQQQNSQQQSQHLTSTNPTTGKKFLLENEVTIQSEINEDHPSGASYYTDVKNHLEETKVSEYSVSLEPKSGAVDQTISSYANKTGIAAAKMMGLNGTYVPHDRHLLVSPALSPAPSTCYSPSPASSYSGVPSLDLNELNEAFRILTFGQNLRPLCDRKPAELHNYHTQHLIQSQNDLNNYISVIFITPDPIPSPVTTPNIPSLCKSKQQSYSSITESLSAHIESNLKSFCDEHLFSLRFLNLNHSFLSQYLHINNLLDVSMRILEQEYRENGQRIILIVLSDNNNSYNQLPDNAQQTWPNTCQTPDKRQLPSRIGTSSINHLLQSSHLDATAKDLLKRWYNQVGNTCHLNPIYLVYPEIAGESRDERDQAWLNWLNDYSLLLKAIELVIDKESESIGDIELKSIYNSQIEFIIRETALHKRTLLIRNYSISATTNINQSQQTHQTISTQSSGPSNDLARLLADPNKLTLKRQMNQYEVAKTINDWVFENFSKFVENIIESKNHAEHVLPYIDRNLFIELTGQRHILEYYLEKTSDNYQTKCQNFYNNQISSLINEVTTSINSNSAPIDQSAPTLSSPAPQCSTNHLVFISGPKGCGKSTLLAQIIKLTAMELYSRHPIIYRFCGQTVDSLSPNRLLRSICEQFCQTQGENITAASYIYSTRKEIMNALNKIIKLQTCLIFIDGLDSFPRSNDADLDWLTEIEASARVKIFIMLETDSDLYKKALSSYTDATYISLDNPSVNEWAQMLVTKARLRRLNSAPSLLEEIKNISSPETREANLTYNDVDNLIQMCYIRQINNETIYPELTAKIVQSNNLKSVLKTTLSHIQYLITPYQLCALCIILNSSRNGLSEADIINIMTMISQSPKVSNNPEQRFPTALLYYLKIQLRSQLLYIICDKKIKLSLKREFSTMTIEYYSSTFPNIVSEVAEILIDYYNRPTKSKSSKGSLVKSDGNINESRSKMTATESLWLATQTSELMNLLIATNPIKAREYIMNKNNFFAQFLYSSMPEEFIEDFELLRNMADKKATQSNEELQLLVNYIKQSIHPLRYDGSQIYSQIYCRAYETLKSGKIPSKSKKLSEILTSATCPPINNMLPISEVSIHSFIKTRIGPRKNSVAAENSESNSQKCTINEKSSDKLTQNPIVPNQVQAKQCIFTIKDNHRHVIVTYPDRGSLSVWDIYEEKAVRTINNLDQPKDVRMIDQKRAVILCNRELRVYDLDTGCMITKLKGVMNQKMPFFEVFGEKYVVALARNRMYVNMMNLDTGELETTFKVGEDRFLNSLLVSANGGICVCGDETQKPFPLLVWNLNERRLMYDLRLERHEFITRMSAISDDGHFVVSVCRQLGDGDAQGSSGGSFNGNNNGRGSSNNSMRRNKSAPNFIVIYDLGSGTLFKKWKPGVDSCGVAISLSSSRSGKVINSIVDSSILIWDLATGSRRHTLMGHSAPVDVIKVQNNRLFSMDSSCRDQSLRIWDIEEGYCLAVFSPDAPVNCCQISIRGDALVCGFTFDTRLSTLVLCKNETVNDIVKRNKRRKSSKSIYVFDEQPGRKGSS